jgi:hypothetical protein
MRINVWSMIASRCFIITSQSLRRLQAVAVCLESDGMQAERLPDEGLPAPSCAHDLRTALAIAIVQRRKQKANNGVDWKRKALCARSALLKLSKRLRQIAASDKGPKSGRDSREVACRLLHELSPDEWSGGHECSTASKSCESQPCSSSKVVQRAEHLSSFVEAIEVTNALSDLLEGRLCRIWEQRPLHQALHAFQTLLSLPSCQLRTDYLNRLSLATKAMVVQDHGELSYTYKRVCVL